MSASITASAVQWAQSSADPWRIGNGVLYDLCREYPLHTDDAQIVAKVWLIGRAYSASIERGRGDTVGADVPNDVFYTDHVAKVLGASKIDEKLAALDGAEKVDKSNVAAVLEAHSHLVDQFEALTSKGKRSLASKYLHFHRPGLFFIYDSRAASSIRKLGVSPQPIKASGADSEYKKFVGAALGVRTQVLKKFGEFLTPRQLDRLLLASFADSGNGP